MSYNANLSVNYQGLGDTHYASSKISQSAKAMRKSTGHELLATATQNAAVKNEWGSQGIKSLSDAYLFMPTPTATFVLYSNNEGIATAYVFDAQDADFEKHISLYMQQANQLREQRGKSQLDWKTFGLTKGTLLAENIMDTATKQNRVVELGRVGVDNMITFGSDVGYQMLGAIFKHESQPYIDNLVSKGSLIGNPKLTVVDPQSDRYQKIAPKNRMILRRVHLGGMTHPDQFSFFDTPYRDEPRHPHTPRGIKTVGHIYANAPFDISGHFVTTDTIDEAAIGQDSLEQRMAQTAPNQRMFDQLLKTGSA